MEFTIHQAQNISSPYVTAPTSPTGLTPQNNIDLILYHSTLSSPCNNNNSLSYDQYSSSFRTTPTSPKFDDFEFGTSNTLLCNTYETTELFQQVQEPQIHSQHELECSHSSMVFADDLFCDGKFIPLKLPPRLQSFDNMKHKVRRNRGGLVASTPTSPLRKATPRHDKFDPFVVALQKVTENRGRRSNVGGYDDNHKRTRSHSPFRANSISTDEDDDLKSNLISVPVDFKGSKYARYVRAQTNSSICNIGGKENSSRNTMMVESKMQRIKGLLLKFATTFGTHRNGNNISGFRKQGYLSRLSYKLKGGNADNGTKRRMFLVKYKPALCIGYGTRSPNNSLTP
ncbi:hypothetical protein LIER_33957 [Lithospermum erythrorhizon]|uniref:Uncharacterized protein n=1 Tax=Lithospermum erythrorhizon TaxID=34254 RepID=A0AAV3RYZ9_LITER